jgi:hypothetical protein
VADLELSQRRYRSYGANPELVNRGYIDPAGLETQKDAGKQIRRDRVIDEFIVQAERPIRICIAFLAGISLMAPMLIMAIHPNLKKSLITANVSLFIFGLAVAWSFPVRKSDLFTGIAAYAAVLVVFVGSTL